MELYQEQLFAMQDLKYRDFHARLIPEISKDRIIGVRTPQLRSLAKNIMKSGETGLRQNFMEHLPHEYYEENNLHGALIEGIKDYDECVAALNQFLPYVDNWATCDLMHPKVLRKNKDRLIAQIKIWVRDETKRTYVIRFGIEMLMAHFLDEEDFKAEYHDLAAQVVSDEYYVNMMIAWYFATALAKQYEATLPYIEERKLPGRWVHNKTIQKALESDRVSEAHKAVLRNMRMK